MTDAEKSFIDENDSNESQLSTEQLEEVAGGAKTVTVCPRCGQGDKITKKVRGHNVMYYYCNRCRIVL